MGVRYSKRRAPGVVGLEENIAIYAIAPSVFAAKLSRSQYDDPATSSYHPSQSQLQQTTCLHSPETAKSTTRTHLVRPSNPAGHQRFGCAQRSGLNWRIARI